MNRVVTAVLALWAAPATALENGPKPPPPVAYREALFGIAIDDPYRWMEGPSRAAERDAWLRASGAVTRAQLAGLPGRAALLDSLRKADTAAKVYRNPVLSRGRAFALRLDAGAPKPRLIVREEDGRERVLFDPGALREPMGIDGFSVAPDGRTIALNLSRAGGEMGAIRFFDVASGQMLLGEIAPIWGEYQAQWIDNRTVTLTMSDPAQLRTDPFFGMRAVTYRLGSPAPGPAVFGKGVGGGAAIDANVHPRIVHSAISDWTVGLGTNARVDALLFVARTSSISAGRPDWRPIAGYADRINDAALLGDDLYVLTTRNSSGGRMLRLPLATPAPLSIAAEITFPDHDIILDEIAAAADGVYVSGQNNGISHLFFIPARASAAREVPLPLAGHLEGLRPGADGRRVGFILADWFNPGRVFAAENGRVRAIGLDSAGAPGASAFEARIDEAISRDGTHVPMAILIRRDLGARPNAPALLEGYGAYGRNFVEPSYELAYLPLLDRGGIVAFCGTRGGGERGREWHEAGREANKPNGHDDLIACGERLIAQGLTSQKRLTVFGASAGGLLVAPAILKRPDLFGAAAIAVGELNPTRLAGEPNGPNQFGEMGDPRTEAGFRALLAQDSYQLLAKARDIPDTLLLIGMNDNRVAPWNTAKFAARALDRFGGRRLILLRTDDAAGHGPGPDRETRMQAYADLLSFVLNRAGADGFCEASAISAK